MNLLINFQADFDDSVELTDAGRVFWWGCGVLAWAPDF